MFAATSFWKQPLPNDVPIDPQSAAVVANVATQAAALATFLYRRFSVSVFIAGPGCPTQKVTVDWKEREAAKGKELQAMFNAVPIPPEFRPPGPEREADNHSVIWQPSTDTAWFMWRVSQFEVDGAHSGAWSWVTGVPAEVLSAPGWHIGNGVKIENISQSPGYSPISTLGPTATRLLFGGAIWPEEARRLHIPHALMATVQLRKAVGGPAPFRWPAQASDGEFEDATYPEAGMIARFPAGMTFASVHDPFVRACCEAIRDYGLVFYDSSGQTTQVAIKAVNRATIRGAAPGTYSTAKDPWRGTENKVGGAGAILTAEPNVLAPQIPWPELRIVDASYRPSVEARAILL